MPKINNMEEVQNILDLVGLAENKVKLRIPDGWRH